MNVIFINTSSYPNYLLNAVIVVEVIPIIIR